MLYILLFRANPNLTLQLPYSPTAYRFFRRLQQWLLYSFQYSHRCNIADVAMIKKRLVDVASNRM
jgi:hypothetical protein